jgi:hypothetical protein
MRYFIAFCMLSTVYADSNTKGPNGIRANGLKLNNGMPLDGSGVGIGMVEGFRIPIL